MATRLGRNCTWAAALAKLEAAPTVTDIVTKVRTGAPADGVPTSELSWTENGENLLAFFEGVDHPDEHTDDFRLVGVWDMTDCGDWAEAAQDLAEQWHVVLRG